MDYEYYSPVGEILGDTLKLNEKLELLTKIDLENEREFELELIMLSKYQDLKIFKTFIYKDNEKSYLIKYKDIKDRLLKGGEKNDK